MEYVYDINLNFQDRYYEFYEWKKEDKIINIKKIPIYKINTKNYINIKNNKVIIDISILPKKNKMFLLTNGMEIFGLIIDKRGKIVKYSSLLLTDSEDILLDKDEIKYLNISYKIIKKNNNILKSRIYEEQTEYLNKYLQEIKNNEYLLKYIYYDIYNKKENNIDKIYNQLESLYKNNISLLYNKIKEVNLELKK